MQPAPDLVVADRFRLTRMLGRGGMGSVWLAQHLGLDIPCAVKFIEGEFSAHAEAQSRFEREAKAAAALRSPHVVQILDHGVWQGTPYMAMELLEGEDFGKRLAHIGRMPPQQVCTIVTQVTRALTKAHAAGIVHRDLKPDNIFLVRDDEREIAKVLDFGIAKQSKTGLDGGATKTGAMLGTPYYMSPEQAQGIKAVDHRSDLWSLGVIVFQALTGRLPFESDALGDLLVRIIVAPIPMMTQMCPDLPPAIDQWWAKAANRDPNGRFQSAKELSDALSMVFSQGFAGEGEMRAPMGSHPGMGAGGYVQANTPPVYGASSGGTSPAPYGTPQPAQGGMGYTPQPVKGTVALPQALQGGATPNPAMGGSTGAPMSRTFAEASAPAKSRAGLFIAIGAAIVVVVGIGVVAKSTGKKDVPANAAGPSSITAPIAPAASSVPSAPVVLPPEPVVAAASLTPPPAPQPAAPGPAGPRPHPGAGGGAAIPPAGGNAAKPTTPKPTAKPADDNLGI